MSTDLHTQLLDYGRDHRERQTPIELDEVRGDIETVVPVVFDQPRRLQGPWAALAAAAVILIMVGVLVVLARSNDQPPVIDQPTTTEAAAPFGEEAALAVTSQFLSDFNAGEEEAVMALLAEDATFTTNATLGLSRGEWERVLYWDLAQGTLVTQHECAADQPAEGAPVTVVCTYGVHNALAQAVGAPPLPVVSTMVITEDGIVEFADEFGAPGYDDLVPGFNAWMFVHHPEETGAVQFLTWDTTEEAAESGRLTARFAEEWATFLEERNCAFPSDCFYQNPATGGQ